MRSLKDDKQGVSAIIYVILCLIVIISLTGIFDIAKRSWVLNEVQSMMDLASHNTLKNSVDLNELQKEILAMGVDKLDSEDLSKVSNFTESQEFKTQMLENFKHQIDLYIATGDTILDYEVQSLNIQFQFTDWGVGNSSKARPQVTLDTLTKVTLKTNLLSGSEQLNSITLKVLKGKNDVDYVQIEDCGTDSDGNTYLIIRNMTRLIYR